MPNKFTEHYNLNQWEPGDKVVHTDFNEDNRKLDGALHGLDASLSALDAALAGKLGHSEIIKTAPPHEGTSVSYGSSFPRLNWDEWEYVCILASMPTEVQETLMKFYFIAEGPQSGHINSFTSPGILVVLLPRHDGSKPAAGFAVSDHLVPFSFGFSYKDVVQMTFATADQSKFSSPGYAIFGGK